MMEKYKIEKDQENSNTQHRNSEKKKKKKKKTHEEKLVFVGWMDVIDVRAQMLSSMPSFKSEKKGTQRVV